MAVADGPIESLEYIYGNLYYAFSFTYGGIKHTNFSGIHRNQLPFGFVAKLTENWCNFLE